MIVFQSFNLLLRFLLELCMLGAVALLGLHDRRRRRDAGAARRRRPAADGRRVGPVHLAEGHRRRSRRSRGSPSRPCSSAPPPWRSRTFASPALAVSFLAVVAANGALMGALGS